MDVFEVRLWDDATQLQISSGFVGGDPLEGHFRFRDLASPIALNGGQTYVMSASMQGNESYTYGSLMTGFVAASDINLIENRSSNTFGDFPINAAANLYPGFFGAEF